MLRLDQASYSTHFLQKVAGEGRDSGGSRQLNQGIAFSRIRAKAFDSWGGVAERPDGSLRNSRRE